MVVIGIDFGTKNCVISQAKRGGIDTVLNEGSKRQTQALVSFQGKQRFMGEQAVPLIKSNYKNTVAQVKRFIGKNWSDPLVQEEISTLPNKDAFSEMDGGRIGVTVQYDGSKVVLSAEDVCAMLIGQLKRTAEYANEGRPVSDLVFSVPSYWTDRQKRAFLASAKIADVSVLGLINDGTAAALSYGIWKSASNQFDANDKEYVMFVDMGYASFQVTIAAFIQGKLQVVAAASDPNLGGRDIDWLLAQHFAKQFQEKHGGDPMSNPKSLLKLLGAVEKAKQTLTPEGVKVAKLHVEFLMNEIDFQSELNLEDFEELIQPLVDRIQDPLERAMEESGLTMDKLNAVEILGGSTRVRSIKRKISQVLELDQTKQNYGLSTTQNADECISRGCALRCAILSPAFRVKEFLVTDSVRYPISLSWEQKDSAIPMEEEDGDEDVSDRNGIIILEKGAETPKTRRLTFRRRDEFEVVASYDESAKADLPIGSDLLLGTFQISGMKNHLGADEEIPRLRVDFRQDEYGLFGVLNAKLLKRKPDEEPTKEEEAGEGEDDKKDEEGDDKKDEEKKKEEKKPKKKVVKYESFPLQVQAKMLGAYDEAEINNARERESKYAQQDKSIEETNAKKNELEEYVYSMRDKISYGALKEYTTEKERESFGSKLEQAENWLYDEGFDETITVYAAKLDELKSEGDRFTYRLQEQEQRPEMIKNVDSQISDFLKVVNSVDEQYSHIEEEEREKVRKACEEFESWLKEKSDLQAEKQLYDDPVFTVADMETKLNGLQIICRPIVNKRKPPPPKKAAKEEKKSDEGKEKDAEEEEEEEQTNNNDDDDSKKEQKEDTSNMDID